MRFSVKNGKKGNYKATNKRTHAQRTQGGMYPAGYPEPPSWPPAPTNEEKSPLAENLSIFGYIVDAFFWCDLLSNFRTGWV
jgi:hypothetical protein